MWLVIGKPRLPLALYPIRPRHFLALTPGGPPARASHSRYTASSLARITKSLLEAFARLNDRIRHHIARRVILSQAIFAEVVIAPEPDSISGPLLTEVPRDFG